MLQHLADYTNQALLSTLSSYKHSKAFARLHFSTPTETSNRKPINKINNANPTDKTVFKIQYFNTNKLPVESKLNVAYPNTTNKIILQIRFGTKKIIGATNIVFLVGFLESQLYNDIETANGANTAIKRL